MSTTSGTPQGTVRLLDEPDVIRKKFRSAQTDSGREVKRGPDKPGITNLVDILAVITDRTPEEVERAYDGSGYGDFKSDVGDAVADHLTPVRERYLELRADVGELQRLLVHGADRAREASTPTLEGMYDRMGFVRPRGV